MGWDGGSGGRSRGFCGCWDGWFGCGIGFGFHGCAALTRSGWVVFAGGDVVVTVLLPLFFLYKVDVGEHDGFLVGVVGVGFGLEACVVCQVDDFPDASRIGVPAAAHDVDPPLSSVGDDFSHVLPSQHAGTSELLTGSCGQRTSFLGSGSGTSLCFVHWDPLRGSPELAAFGEEAFPCVPFPQEGLVLIPQLVPQAVEGFVVGTVDVVAELVQHGIHHLLERQELPFVPGVPQPQAYLLPSVPVET